MNLPDSPYVGLVPYTEDQEPLFFGRDKERRTIAFNLMGARLTLVYGPAGVGKSSVLRAGVSHDLHRLAQENLKNHNHQDFVVVVFNSWGDDPVKALKTKALISAKPKPDLELNLNLLSLCETLAALSKEMDLDFLIILDQFEYFLYDQTEKRSPFVDELSDAVNSPTLRANFLLSIREDALSKLDIFKNEIPELFENMLRIEHLRTSAARQAIQGPLRVYSQETFEDPPFFAEPELVDAVCDQIVIEDSSAAEPNESAEPNSQSEPEGSPIEASLLQLVMEALWKEERRSRSKSLRLQTLKTLGNTKVIVENHLTNEMNRLTDGEKQSAAKTFDYLVTPSGGKIAHTVKDLAIYAKQKEDVLRPVLERLTHARILRKVPSRSRGSENSRFEIFHGVFALAVLEWSYRYKVNKDLSEERTRLRRRLIVVGLVALGLLAVAVVTSLLAKKARSAETKAQKAEAESVRLLNNYEQLQRDLPLIHAVLQGHSGPVFKAVFSHSSKLVATISEDGTARLWDADTGEQQAMLPLQKPITDIAFKFDDSLVTIAHHNVITLWDINNNTTSELVGHAGDVSRIAFSPVDHDLLASGDEVGLGIVWNIVEKKEIQRLHGPQGHQGRINDVEWSPRNLLLVTAGKDSTARIWDAISGQAVTPIRHEGPVLAAMFSPDGREVITASEDWSAKLSKTKDGVLIRNLRGHSGPVYSVDWVHFSLVTAGGDRTTRIWDRYRKKDLLVSTFLGYAEEVRGARFSTDGNRIITWGGDRTTRIWNTGAKTDIKQKPLELSPHLKSVNYAEFNSQGTFAVTASADYTARVWDLSDSVFGVSEVSVERPSFSGNCPATIHLYGKISVTGAGGQVRYRFVVNGRTMPVHSVSFDGPQSKSVAASLRFDTGSSGTVYLEIISPKAPKSPAIDYHVRCEKTSAEEKKTGSEPGP
jgi:WD40 repeat protein